ncbi:MAG: hypothetical protein LWY06_16215 [Firmicutes bacterium]|nr:hypothetical protein [Bacillota bacterium]
MTENRQVKVAVIIFVVGFLLSVLVGVGTYTYYSKYISDMQGRQLSDVTDKIKDKAPLILKKSKSGAVPAKLQQELKNAAVGIDNVSVVNNKKIVVASTNNNQVGKSLSGMLKTDRLPDIFSIKSTGFIQEQADNAMYLGMVTPIFSKKNDKQKTISGYVYVNVNSDKEMQKFSSRAVEMSLIILGFSFIASAMGYSLAGNRRIIPEGEIVIKVSTKDENLSIVDEMTRKEMTRARWVDPDLAMLHARQFGGRV